MIHRVVAWLAYRVIIARPLADVLHRRFRMSKYHARKSSPQSRDQRGNSSPYCLIWPPGGSCVEQPKAPPTGAYGEIIKKEEQPARRSCCACSRAQECARKVRINGVMHVSVDGLYSAWTSPPSRVASLVFKHGKNAIKRSCVSRNSGRHNLLPIYLFYCARQAEMLVF